MGFASLPAELRHRILAFVDDDRHLASAAQVSRALRDDVQITYASPARRDERRAILASHQKIDLGCIPTISLPQPLASSAGTLRAAGGMVPTTLTVWDRPHTRSEALDRLVAGSALRLHVEVSAYRSDLFATLRRYVRPNIDLTLCVCPLAPTTLANAAAADFLDNVVGLVFDSIPFPHQLPDHQFSQPAPIERLSHWPQRLLSLDASLAELCSFPALEHPSCRLRHLGLTGNTSLLVLPFLRQMQMLVSLRLAALDEFDLKYALSSQHPYGRPRTAQIPIAQALLDHPLPDTLVHLSLGNVDLFTTPVPFPRDCKHLQLSLCPFAAETLALPARVETVNIAYADPVDSLFRLQLPDTVQLLVVYGNSEIPADERRARQLEDYFGVSVQLTE